MERQTGQANWELPISRFLEYVKTDCEFEILDPGLPEVNTPAKTRPFMPVDRIQEYFEKQEYKEFRSIIAALFPKSDPINPREILPKYTSVFCTLLFIGRGQYIKLFRHYDSLNDTALPFDPASPPAHLPETPGDENFMRDFCQAQWRFCAPILEDPVADKHFESDRVLPIIFKKRLAGGGTANLWLIKIHPSYNKLISLEAKKRLGDLADTFVLKEYSTLDAENYYDNETAAFNKIGSNPNIIGYYGSFRRGARFNVILEYADHGNLKEFFQEQDPPTTGENIIKFWQGLFKLVNALRTVHSVEQFAEDGPRIFQGWHQDVRPENILVVSNGDKPSYEWQFKLADLGISHFKAISTSRENSTASDTYGTRTYGAPECFRPDQVTGQTKLKVNQNIDIWSLGCVYSEAVCWIPSAQKYAGILAYCEERRAEIDGISAFDGVDCFHNGLAALEAVRTSHEKAIENLHRKDSITERVVELIHDMLVTAEARPSAHWLWQKQLRILETARKKLRPPGEGPQSPSFGKPNALAGRRQPTPRQTDPIPGGQSSKPPLPPVLPPGFGVEVATSPAVYRAYWDPPDPSHVQIYDNNPTILGDEEGSQRYSPDHLTEHGDESVEPSPSGKRNSQKMSPNQSPPQQTKSTTPGYHYRDHRNLENIEENQFGVRTAQASGQGLSRPRGASQISDNSNPRYGAPSTGMAPGTTRSTMTDNQMQSLPNQPAPNGIGYYRLETMPHGQDPFVEVAPTPQDATMVQNYQDSGNSPLVSSPNAQSPTSAGVQHLNQQEHRPQLLPIQKPTEYMSVQDALDWKAKCKRMRAHAPGLNKDLQNRLKGRDHVFLIDDSQSMMAHWPIVCKVFEALSYIVKETDKDGIDLYFTISENFQKNVKNTSPLISMLENHKQRKDSTTDINFRLTKILDEYKSNLDNKKRWYRSEPKPLSLYILTDGLWENECNAVEPIRNAVRKLEDLRKDDQQIGIQFISFGNDPKALSHLRHLDNGLNLPKDIVDTVPCHGNVYKMLLGSFSKWFDSQDQLSSTRSPPSELSQSPTPTGYAR